MEMSLGNVSVVKVPFRKYLPGKCLDTNSFDTLYCLAPKNFDPEVVEM